MLRKLGLAMLLATVASVASATPPGVSCTTEYFWGIFPYEVCTSDPSHRHIVAAPEMDASSAIAGLTLMVGGLAVLRGRRRKVAKTK
jgi:LPXTG-motif cell wall-anchored protein